MLCSEFSWNPEKEKILRELGQFVKLGVVVALQLITTVGLIGQLGTDDSPKYSVLKTDLLNPWATWCPQGCYGTGWAHWGGPYSIFWYWANALLSLNGMIPLTLSYFLGNIVLQILFYRSRLAIPFAIAGLFGILAYPQNMIILWFLFLGFYQKWGLVLAPAFKFPLGDFSGRMISFLWTSSTSVREPDNWPVYLCLGLLWVLGFLSVRSKVRKVSLEITHQENDPSPFNPDDKRKKNHQEIGLHCSESVSEIDPE